MSEPPVLLSKWYEYTKWVISRVDQFPKNQRFILGQRLVDTSLDIQECLIEGAYSRGVTKRDQLSTANRKIEQTRLRGQGSRLRGQANSNASDSLAGA
jgi:hypothetical protein